MNPISNVRLEGTLTATVGADSVILTYAVRNPTASPVQLTFTDSQQYDFAIDAGSQRVWHWSADRMFAQALTNRSWAPGEVVTYTEKWRPTTHGVLTVHAWLAKATERAAATTSIEVR